MRKLWLGLTIALGVVYCSGIASAEPYSDQSGIIPPLNLNVAGKAISLPMYEPGPYVNTDGRAMVPFRVVCEALGMVGDDIRWDGKTSTVTVGTGEFAISLTVGDSKIKVGTRKEIEMDTQVEMHRDRLFVPAKYIAEAFSGGVEYDATTRTVFIYPDGATNVPRFGLLSQGRYPIGLQNKNLRIDVTGLHIYAAGSDEMNNVMESHYFLADKQLPYYLIAMDANFTNDRFAKESIDNVGNGTTLYGLAFNESSYASFPLQSKDPENPDKPLSLAPGEKKSSTVYFLVYSPKLDYITLINQGISFVLANR